MSISWDGVPFDGPYRLDGLVPPRRSAVYAVMCRLEPLTQPDTYRILYFGETGDLSDRGLPWSHQSVPCWLRSGGSRSNLYIGLHYTPGLTEEQRRLLERRLTTRLQPPCNMN